jgi:uncharacterized protein
MERRFFADAMLGKLAAWLRAAGCDVAYSRDIGDDDLIRRAKEEERLILTRDTLLARRRWARENHFLVEGDRWRDQLRQVTAAFGIDPFAGFLTRCLRCNEPLAGAASESVERLVPPYVRSVTDLFRECPACGRVYWPGTHRERMEGELRRIVERQ